MTSSSTLIRVNSRSLVLSANCIWTTEHNHPSKHVYIVMSSHQSTVTTVDCVYYFALPTSLRSVDVWTTHLLKIYIVYSSVWIFVAAHTTQATKRCLLPPCPTAKVRVWIVNKFGEILRSDPKVTCKCSARLNTPKSACPPGGVQLLTFASKRPNHTFKRLWFLTLISPAFLLPATTQCNTSRHW